MKIPAIKARIGIWIYYVAALKFSQVEEYVSRIDDELHKSTVLREMSQRSITDNYKILQIISNNKKNAFLTPLYLPYITEILSGMKFG